MPGVLGVLLRASPEGPRRPLPGEDPQAGSSRGAAETEAVRAPRQSAEAVLPHGPAVRVFPVRPGETQGPRRGARGGGASDTTGEFSSLCFLLR